MRRGSELGAPTARCRANFSISLEQWASTVRRPARRAGRVMPTGSQPGRVNVRGHEPRVGPGLEQERRGLQVGRVVRAGHGQEAAEQLAARLREQLAAALRQEPQFLERLGCLAVLVGPESTASHAAKVGPFSDNPSDQSADELSSRTRLHIHARLKPATAARPSTWHTIAAARTLAARSGSPLTSRTSVARPKHHPNW